MKNYLLIRNVLGGQLLQSETLISSATRVENELTLSAEKVTCYLTNNQVLGEMKYVEYEEISRYVWIYHFKDLVLANSNGENCTFRFTKNKKEGGSVDCFDSQLLRFPL
jgi:hypothetical protein